MDVLTAGQTGTPAVEAPAGDRGGTKPRKQLWYTVLAVGIMAASFLTLRTGAPVTEAPAGDHGGTNSALKTVVRPPLPSTPGKQEQVRSTVVALGIAVALFFAAWRLHGNTSSAYRIDSQWGAFAGLFILALAIERAVEPFSRRLGPDTTTFKAARDKILASAQADDREAIAVECRPGVDMCRRLTGVVTWGVATGLAFLLCAQLNITLMQAVSAKGSGAPPFWADLLVTGLVVGAGTKPLHDLVSNIEQGKK
jgi:hypothetical protein